MHPARVARTVISSGLGWVLNCVVTAVVLSLPVMIGAAASGPASVTEPAAAVLPTSVARAQTASRSGTIAAGRSPVTLNAPDTRPIREHRLGELDTLASVAAGYGVSAEAIAFANGITDPLRLEAGRILRIPPGEGALYTVGTGDTVESVAARFGAAQSAVMEYNRLYFEPQNFAPGKLIFVPGAVLPTLVYVYDAVPEPAQAPRALTPPAAAPVSAPPAAAPRPAVRPGALSMPVGGTITQNFWSAHQGVDVAAPYGTAIRASAPGTVSATGWVAIGGLRVCVAHGGGLETCYYHTATVFVGVGQFVDRGQAIAAIGMTGVTTGPHVHWEARLNGALVNPLAYR